MFSTSQGMRKNYIQNIPLQGTLTNSIAQIEALQLEMFIMPLILCSVLPLHCFLFYYSALLNSYYFMKPLKGAFHTVTEYDYLQIQN